ncbi:zinc finger protein ZOP1 [Malania oleifera]|uniref:zinc finger protein ZOP1 n=1 Tax=Malania oleifera TaxID=397392 RepID=UPI0025AE03CF|nr:zinc finger protein ZOP1 [Malania oleifera]XP_057965193.1 zinc finger protein ZOP1 [Malania oleifera]
MTEYWVSQGNKWCEFCKIFISNNPSSIRNHELGQRHKDNVAKRLASMRKEKAAKEKEEKEAARALEQIEAKAKRSYQKDIATFRETRDANVQALGAQEDDDDLGSAKSFAASRCEWDYDSTSGYYYNQATGCYYDPNSGFYYSDSIGKWVTQEEAFAALQVSSDFKPKESTLKKLSSSEARQVPENKNAVKSQNGTTPGLVVSVSLNPMRSIKGAPSSVTVGKRKRPDEKPKAMSEEEAAALKAREAAKKRVERREKNLLGLYNSR